MRYDTPLLKFIGNMQKRDAVAGFEAMGSKERMTLLKEAVAFFGSNGPSTDRNARQEQLSKLYRKNDSLFEELRIATTKP